MKSSPTNLRGQMGLRSGPLAPTSAKLTTQYLVLDHMNNHYSKITKAKPAIDNRPPKSMASSQKARDRKSRDVMEKIGRRHYSSMTNRSQRPYTSTGYYQDDIYDENLWGEVDPYDEEAQLIQNIMRTTLRGNDQDHDPDSMQPSSSHYPTTAHRTTTYQRPGSARSARSITSGMDRTMVQTKKPGTYDGDLLQKRSHVFTEEKPFTPRTLKTDRKSRLSQYKYYNKVPPKESKPKQQQQQQQQASASGQATETANQETSEQRPQPKPRAKRLDQTREGPVTMNSLMFETLHSRDFSKKDESNPDVPKLDISMDTDHLKWIKDQASKAQYRSNNDTMKSTLREEDPNDTTVDYGKTGEMSLTYGTLGSTKTRQLQSGSARPTSPQDEERLYVQFMKDVTNDIINRGIYTDRAVRLVFKTHIAKNKGKLDELRMRQITDDIRTQLNIPRYDINDDTSLTMTNENYKPHYNNNADLQLNLTSSTVGQGLGGTQTSMNGTLETSEKSKGSRYSTDASPDTYNFRSTEDDDVYSTIRSDMNTATLTDTMALRSYQASIKEQDGEELEEGEVVVREDHCHPEHFEQPSFEKRRAVQNVEDAAETRSVQNGQAETRSQSGRESDRATNDGTDYQDEEDDYDDEVYEDDGDDEDDDNDDIVETTEPTATYRTDDDDF